jgi:hypothetical protein
MPPTGKEIQGLYIARIVIAATLVSGNKNNRVREKAVFLNDRVDDRSDEVLIDAIDAGTGIGRMARITLVWANKRDGRQPSPVTSA